MIQSFTNKLSDIILRPKSFFDEMESDGGYKEPLIFSFFIFLPVTLLGILLYKLGLPQMIVLVDMANNGKDAGIDQISANFFFLRTIAWVIGLFLMSALFHVGFKLMGGVGSFESTYRIVAFTSSTYIFNLIPGIGIFINGFYSLFLVVIGCKAVHKIPTGKSIIGSLIPLFFLMTILMLLQSFKQKG